MNQTPSFDQLQATWPAPEWQQDAMAPAWRFSLAYWTSSAKLADRAVLPLCSKFSDLSLWHLVIVSNRHKAVRNGQQADLTAPERRKTLSQRFWTWSSGAGLPATIKSCWPDQMMHSTFPRFPEAPKSIVFLDMRDPKKLDIQSTLSSFIHQILHSCWWIYILAHLFVWFRDVRDGGFLK